MRATTSRLIAAILALAPAAAGAFYRTAVIGDSVGTGYGLAESDPGFAQQVAAELRKSHDQVRMINLSQNGYSLGLAERQIDSLLNFSGRPAICIIELGGNDYLAKVPAADSAARLANVCAAIRRRYPRTQLVIVGFGYGAEKSVVYEAVARRFDALCVCDFDWEKPEAREQRQSDGIHPTAVAHREIAHKILAALAHSGQKSARRHD